MVTWSDPQEVARDAAAFQKLIFTLFGLYVWELFLTWDFEWSLIRGRRKFRWPLVCTASQKLIPDFFFNNRITSLTVTTEINCRALYTFNSWSGNMTILCASTSLMLRTVALWERRRWVAVFLGVLCLSHWGMLYRTMFIVIAEWEPTVGACVVVQTMPTLLNVTFFYTMFFDLIILLFSAVALLGKHSARTDLWKLLFKDGLVYFMVSFSMNCIPAVLNVMNLNSTWSYITGGQIPAASITAIASCRAVIRLQEFNASGDVYVHSVSLATNSNTARQTIAVPKLSKKAKKFSMTRPEVHVTTEQITMAEFS
ncbi:hypothetical protein BDQ17DRAFT_1236446 [Cyathus striatus]|nr:hypothetical protein BDQ17DRAFT_1236446 [Cyathus striatus]